jgi:endonuclease YncB( thermonuclease family)
MYRTSSAVGLAIAAVLSVASFDFAAAQQRPSQLTVRADKLTVVDGDTIESADGNVRYRVYGLDAPEIRSAGCEAEVKAGTASKEVAKRIIAAAGTIRIEPTGRVQPATDRYRERVEAGFVIDGRDFNELMIAAGAARKDVRGDARWCDVLSR